MSYLYKELSQDEIIEQFYKVKPALCELIFNNEITIQIQIIHDKTSNEGRLSLTFDDPDKPSFSLLYDNDNKETDAHTVLYHYLLLEFKNKVIDEAYFTFLNSSNKAVLFWNNVNLDFKDKQEGVDIDVSSTEFKLHVFSLEVSKLLGKVVC